MAGGVCLRCSRTAERLTKRLCIRCYQTVWRRGGWEPPPTPARPVARWAAYPEDHSWTARSACASYPDLPWAETRITAEMRAICGTCPVKAECLAEALADPHIVGVWGGTTAVERGRAAPVRQRR